MLKRRHSILPIRRDMSVSSPRHIEMQELYSPFKIQKKLPCRTRIVVEVVVLNDGKVVSVNCCCDDDLTKHQSDRPTTTTLRRCFPVDDPTDRPWPWPWHGTTSLDTHNFETSFDEYPV
jgi:hypothetical protein